MRRVPAFVCILIWAVLILGQMFPILSAVPHGMSPSFAELPDGAVIVDPNGPGDLPIYEPDGTLRTTVPHPAWSMRGHKMAVDAAGTVYLKEIVIVWAWKGDHWIKVVEPALTWSDNTPKKVSNGETLRNGWFGVIRESAGGQEIAYYSPPLWTRPFHWLVTMALFPFIVLAVWFSKSRPIPEKKGEPQGL